MSHDEILRVVEELARRHLGWSGRLSAESRLVEDLGLDSLKLLTLAIEVENHFRVCLDEQDESAIETVGDLVAIIETRLAAGTQEATG